MKIKPGQIGVKNTEILRGLMERRFSPMLITIILFIADKYGVFITESYRPKKHRNDLHGTQPVRAVDAGSRCYSLGTAKKIEQDVNNLWAYDPDRPKKRIVIIHDAGQGVHFHIQTHPNTRQRGYV